jgi:chondroitin 4-sulfotransferase 11
MKKTLYIRIPKTASSSILHGRRRLPRFFYTRIRGNRGVPGWKGRNWWNVPAIQRGKHFTFSFVRNPFARAVSSWKFGTRGGNWGCDFKNFAKKIQGLNLGFPENKSGPMSQQGIDWGLIHHTQFQYPYILDDAGNSRVDFIGKYENLQEDFNTVCDKIGLRRRRHLPHKNKTKHKHYTEYYDDETRALIAEKFAKDIEYFGYKFGE